MHKRSLLDNDIQQLNALIEQMGQRVDTAVEQAITALMLRDEMLAQIVLKEDEAINALRHTVEKEALQTIARQQPMAGDLRVIMAAVYVALDLERMGDHAVNIARLVLRVQDEEGFRSLHNIPKMARRARQMVRDGVRALLTRDTELATQVMDADERIDDRYGDLIQATAHDMRDDAYITRGTTLLLVGQNLERIGDRATNIVERVQFVTAGVFEEVPSEPDF